ncbi:MAG: hypothetical protein CVU00_13670, partial [Bacteroidetes bacterium HGW-Bacteroidetes-17]
EDRKMIVIISSVRLVFMVFPSFNIVVIQSFLLMYRIILVFLPLINTLKLSKYYTKIKYG